MSLASIATVDWVLFGVIALSAGLGIWRGLIRELVALAVWIVAALTALRYAEPLARFMPAPASWEAARVLLAVLAIVVAALLAGALLAWLLGRLVAAARLSPTDRALGAIFGLIRGVAILGVAVLFLAPTGVLREPPWRDSIVLPRVEAAVRFASPWLPPALTRLAPPA